MNGVNLSYEIVDTATSKKLIRYFDISRHFSSRQTVTTWKKR